MEGSWGKVSTKGKRRNDSDDSDYKDVVDDAHVQPYNHTTICSGSNAIALAGNGNACWHFSIAPTHTHNTQTHNQWTRPGVGAYK